MIRIVCAAIEVLTKDGAIIICGARHFDPIMRKQLKYLMNSVEVESTKQGFIDQHGKFLTREASYLVAEAANQITDPSACILYGNAKKLFSEGLY